MKIRLLILFVFLLASCSADKPNKVVGEIHFGHYTVSPPLGYWYFPRSYPENFDNSETFFLLSFFKNKDALINNVPDFKETLFNIGVLKNSYTDYERYYNYMQKQEFNFNDLSSQVNNLLTFKEWSCKQPVLDNMYVIECISLKDNLVAISAIGENETQIVRDIDILKEIITSFKTKMNYNQSLNRTNKARAIFPMSSGLLLMDMFSGGRLAQRYKSKTSYQ